MMKKKKTKIRIPSAKSEDQPATRKMLTLVRDELRSDIRVLGKKTDSEFQIVKSDIKDLKSDVETLKSDVKTLKADVKTLKADVRVIKSDVGELKVGFQKLESAYFRMELLFEEQNANNRIVLEGLQALWQRQDRLEQRLS